MGALDRRCGDVRLAERLREAGGELVIWDVGLGAAANAMAAIRCYEAATEESPVRPLKIISFENDLDSLRLARRHPDKFTYLHHAGPAGILEEGRWESKQHPGLSWELVSGDFLETLTTASAPPDLVFYDMFSAKTAADQWTCEAFRRLYAACGSRAVELFTYTCSTSIRAALLAAGFYVGRGRSTGLKQETTVALTPEACRPTELRHELLSKEWLGRWHRSGAKFPVEMHVDEHPSFERMITAHEQFARV